MAKTQEQILAEAEVAKQNEAAARAASFANEADIDRRFTEMLEKDAKAERDREETELNLRRTFQTLNDIGGVIGDMVKARDGAVVSPRDIEQHYNRLDERQRMVFDNYRARVDLARKQFAEREMGRERQKRAALGKDYEDRLKLGMAGAADEYRRWKTEQDNAARLKVAQERAAARVKTRTLPSGEQDIIVPFAGHDYSIKKKEYDGRMAQLYSYLDKNHLFPEASGANDDLKNVMALINSGNGSNAAESSKAKLNIAVLVALGYINADSTYSKDIIDILNGTYGKPAAAAASKPAAAKQTTDSKIAPWRK